MRKVFTSARLENVERVAKLLEDDGIEVRITNGRSYKGGIHGNFSYRGEGNKMPEVWVVRSADQPRARDAARGRADGLHAQRTGQLPVDGPARHVGRSRPTQGHEEIG